MFLEEKKFVCEIRHRNSGLILKIKFFSSSTLCDAKILRIWVPIKVLEHLAKYKASSKRFVEVVLWQTRFFFRVLERIFEIQHPLIADGGRGWDTVLGATAISCIQIVSGNKVHI